MNIPVFPKPTSYLRASCVGLALTLTASVASAQDYYVRGDFNGWTNSDSPMTNHGGGLFSYQATGLTPGSMSYFKVTVDDWSVNWPGSNARVMVDANGEINFRAFDSTTWSDGWLPDNGRRVGYSDPGHGWELIGSLNDWAGTALTDMGNGLHRGEVFLAAGTYEYKYRMTGSWDISIGDDFGNSAENIALNVGADDTYVFQLDLMNGRYDVAAIPEPSTYAAIFGGLALLGAFVYRRRSNAKK